MSQASSMIRLTIVHHGAESATNRLWSDLSAAGFKPNDCVAHEKSKSGKWTGVIKVEIKNNTAAVKTLKTWVKKSGFTARVQL